MTIIIIGENQIYRDHIVIRSRPDSARIPVSHLLGSVASRSSGMTNGADHSNLTKVEGK